MEKLNLTGIRVPRSHWISIFYHMWDAARQKGLYPKGRDLRFSCLATHKPVSLLVLQSHMSGKIKREFSLWARLENKSLTVPKRRQADRVSETFPRIWGMGPFAATRLAFNILMTYKIHAVFIFFLSKLKYVPWRQGSQW